MNDKDQYLLSFKAANTSEHCLTVSRPRWSWQWVFVNCYDVYEWPWNGFVVVAKGSATKAGDAVSIDLPEPGDGVSFDMAVTPHAAQQLVISAKRIDMNDGGYVQVLQPEGEGWAVLAEAPVGDGENMVIPFIPDYGNIRIAFWGRLRGLFYTICDQKQEWVAEEQLVTICDEDKDKYRWGFNGQEKVNEWSGIGNHNTAQFWEYDTRTGRRMNLDPVVKPWESGYATFRNSPIAVSDPDGRDGVVSGSGSQEDPYVVKANYYHTGLSEAEQAGLQAAIAQYNNKDREGNNQAWKIKLKDGAKIYVKFELQEFKRNSIEEAKKDAQSDFISGTGNDGREYHFGNIVDIGSIPQESGRTNFAATGSNEITFDREATEGYMNGTPPGSGQAASLYKSIFVHEIGHSLAGNHGDPGNITSDIRAREEVSGGISGPRTGKFTYSTSTVTQDGIRAIIGRINAGRFALPSKYITEKELKRVQKANPNDKDGNPTGTGAQLLQPGQ